MRLFTFVTAALVLPFASSAPSAQPSASPIPPGPKYFLKVNAPDQPWHGRHIVRLPTSGRLGLENFTVHPETLPVWLVPKQAHTQPEEQFALEVNTGSCDLPTIPLVTALTSNLWTGSKSASLRVLQGESLEDVNDDCPDVAQCKADGWKIHFDGSDRPAPLTFEGYPGVFTVVKDASPEGWHVYWESTEEMKHKKKPLRGTEIVLEVWFYGAS